MKLTRWMLLIVILLLALPTIAQETSVAESNLPPTTLLNGFTWIHQGTNRCSAAALSIHLSYYQPVTAETYYALAGRELNTFGADASVRIEEMAAVAQKYGHGAVVRRGGTIELMKQLLAAGFPILVENSYFEGDDWYHDWLSHNRVLMGYDENLGEFYFQDPLLGYPDGKRVAYKYADFDARWRPFNRDYMVLYHLQDEALVQSILGEQWDKTFNANYVLEVSQAEIANGQADNYAYFNLGWAQLQLGMNEEAAASFEAALNLGLPMRMLWYEFGPFEAYLAVGRYEDVIYLVNQQINVAGDSISIEEWYYYAGMAYEAMGNRERAMLNYEVAVVRNTNFTEAAERLQNLRSQ
jgi:tetratricopeptide (TPR) repeat protein